MVASSPLTVHEATAQHARPADRCIMVIFGASGDLTTRKLIPALYNLGRNDLLPREFAILGFAKDEITEDDYRKLIHDDIHAYSGVTPDCSLCRSIADNTYYMQGDFANVEDYARLEARIKELEERHHTGGNVFYYFATLPQFFPLIVEQLGRQGLAKESPPLAPGHHRKTLRQRPRIGQIPQP